MSGTGDLLARRAAAVSRGVANAYPIYAARAENAELWDLDGRCYVDFGGGIAVLKRHALGRSFFEPTVLSGLTADMAIAREETFGQVAGVFSFETEEEAIEAANATKFGLAAYMFARDVGRVLRVSEKLQYGMVGIDSGLISTELAPFGGIKESESDREGSERGIDEYLDRKYLLVQG